MCVEIADQKITRRGGGSPPSEKREYQHLPEAFSLWGPKLICQLRGFLLISSTSGQEPGLLHSFHQANCYSLSSGSELSS